MSALVAVLVAAHGSASGATYRVVATTESPLPGVPGTNFSGFDPPVVNNLGRVGFRGHYLGGEGIFSEGSGVLATEARVGATVPTLSATFESFAEIGPHLNDQGDVAFLASFGGGSGVFSRTGGSLTTVARTGTTPPGGSLTFLLFHHLALNQNGHLSFTGFTAPTAAQIYTTVGGPLTQFVGLGTAVPSNGFTHSTLTGGNSSVLSNDGQIAFIGNSGTARHGYYAGEVGSTTKDAVVLWTDPTPFPPRTFDQPSFRPTINAAGRVAFVISHDLSGGVYYWDGGAPQPIATNFTDVPGAAPGVTFNGVGPPALNEAGTVAFHAASLGGFGLYRFDYEDSGLLERLVMNGQPAPGTSGDYFLNPFAPLLSESGQVAFASMLQSGKRGIWAFGANGGLRLIALEQSAFDHDGLPGTPDRTIEAVSLISDSQSPRSPSDGTGTAFNAENELAFSLRFTAASGGGAGVYVVDVDAVAVPEPATIIAALWMAAAGQALRLARRKA